VTIHTIVNGVSLLLMVLMGAQPIFLIGMFGALSSLRIRREAQGVVLTGLDGPMFAAGLICALLTSVGVVFLGRSLGVPWLHLVLASISSFVLPYGCRVRLEVRPEFAACSRSVLWVLPWNRSRSRSATAWVDGWGDMSDPLAVHVGAAGADRSSLEGSDGFAVELAWVSPSKDASADRLVRDFNQAVSGLRAP